MPVRPLNLNIMIGDTMNNDQKYPSPIDKFKNDHLSYPSPEPTKNANTSSNSSVSSGPRVLNKIPNTFRQWPDPPPPPSRTRKLEKKIPSIRKRPGSADPRFHRHITDHSEKPNLVTQSDVKILKKNALIKEQNCLQHNSESTPMACYRRNLHINHVNEWLQSQVSATAQSQDSGSRVFSKSSIANEIVIVDSKFCQTEKDKAEGEKIDKHKSIDNGSIITEREDKIGCIKQMEPLVNQSHILNNVSETDSEYRETLNLMPNDVVHKYPDYSKLSQFEIAESEASFVSELTDKIMCPSGSAPCLESVSKNTIPLRSRLTQIEDLYERSNRLSPLIERNDSQLLLMCSNPEATGFFCKSFPYTFSWSTFTFWICFSSFACVMVAVLVSLGPILRDFLGALLGRVYGKPPEETFVDKYIVGPFFEGPFYVFGKFMEKLLALLVMPVNARH